jgi:hypothetical protein
VKPTAQARPPTKTFEEGADAVSTDIFGEFFREFFFWFSTMRIALKIEANQSISKKKVFFSRPEDSVLISQI